MANEQEADKTSELAEQHHWLDWCGISRHFEATEDRVEWRKIIHNAVNRRIEED